MTSEMIGLDELRRVAQRFRCGECSARINVAWKAAPPPAWGKGEWVLRCGRDASHSTIKRASRTRQLYDSKKGWRDYNIMTQKEVGIPGVLAVPQTREAMLERANQTVQAGLWPQTMTPNQKALMVQVALAYGLDPLMGELVLYQGKPLVTINARRRKDVEAGHHPSIKFRFLTAEEKQGYLDAGAIDEGDLVQVAVLTTEWGNSVEGIGKVTKAERAVTSERSRDPRKLAHPILADNPIEICHKRAEGRTRLMAYGPIPLPQMPGIMVSEIAVEGEALDQGDAAPARLPVPERRGRDLERDIDDLFPTDPPPADERWPDEEAGEFFDPATAAPPPLPAHVSAMTHFEAVLKERGWTTQRLEADVLHMPLTRYLTSHTIDQVYQLFRQQMASGTP